MAKTDRCPHAEPPVVRCWVCVANDTASPEKLKENDAPRPRAPKRRLRPSTRQES